jgi:hypothetical protein
VLPTTATRTSTPTETSSTAPSSTLASTGASVHGETRLGLALLMGGAAFMLLGLRPRYRRNH